ncbi:hypothetical protein LCGC14_1989660 [marine sediment metagenome]|uniref:Uncharacterized protein n=1 Tax=marine sediment metagenome TaxID=412755 RepID=A0A0F9F690_9ZZZZ
MMIDTVRGVLRVRKWPKKRGPPRSELQRWWVDWFKQANRLAKYADPMSQARAIEMTKGSGLYPRDILLKAMRGRLYTWADQDGNKWYPMAGIQDISDTLDILAQFTGGVLTRAADRWRAPTPGDPGDVLTYQGAAAGAEWQPAASGGGFAGGALATATVDQTVTSGVLTAVDFDGEVYDTASLLDPATDKTAITIPAGWEWARLNGAVRWASNSTGFRLLRFDLNGAIFPGCATHRKKANTESEDSITSPVIPVSEGDVFKLMVYQTKGSNLDLFGDPARTYFACQKL